MTVEPVYNHFKRATGVSISKAIRCVDVLYSCGLSYVDIDFLIEMIEERKGKTGR